MSRKIGGPMYAYRYNIQHQDTYSEVLGRHLEYYPLFHPGMLTTLPLYSLAVFTCLT